MLLVDKPEGITSFGVVRQVRRRLGGARAGHVGSLDPFATGLLPVLVGRATRFARFLSAGAKRYRAVVRFGRATDTDDRTGAPVGPAGPLPSGAAVREALAGFLGDVPQRPPTYSAKRIAGKRAYRLARAGLEPDLAPAIVRFDRLDLVAFDGSDAEIECDVGPGAYIRALARDLGERLGTAAHLAELRREAVGDFGVGEAFPLAGIEALPDAEAVWQRVLPPLAALRGLPQLDVGEAAARALGHGRAVTLSAAEGEAAEAEVRVAVRRLAEAPGLVAVVRFVEGRWQPVVVWTPR